MPTPSSSSSIWSVGIGVDCYIRRLTTAANNHQTAMSTKLRMIEEGRTHVLNISNDELYQAMLKSSISFHHFHDWLTEHLESLPPGVRLDLIKRVPQLISVPFSLAAVQARCLAAASVGSVASRSGSGYDLAFARMRIDRRSPVHPIVLKALSLRSFTIATCGRYRV